jgi:hypothetical protein
MGVSCVCRCLGTPVVALALSSCAEIPGSSIGAALDDTPPVAVAGSMPDVRDEAVLRKCHDALVKVAAPYGLRKGTISSFETDGSVALLATVVYRRRGGPETRTALVDCHLNPDGDVVGFTER